MGQALLRPNLFYRHRVFLCWQSGMLFFERINVSKCVHQERVLLHTFPRPKLSLVVMMLEVPIWKAGICSLHEGTLSLHHLQLESSIAYLKIFFFLSMT